MTRTEELKQAADKYKFLEGDVPSTELEKEISKLGFVDGANWQAERMYTKEELREAMEYGFDYGYHRGFSHGVSDDPEYEESGFKENNVFEDFLKLKK